MWSGPRNLSTALMRSFENRKDTLVWDEPMYAYYLNETNKKHPLANNIVKKYETNINKLIPKMTERYEKKHSYQKHMTHHILSKTPIDWVERGVNCFLIREPSEVIKSYIKKSKLNYSEDIGFPMQIKLFNFVTKIGNKAIVINAEDLARNPRKVLINLCKKIGIPFLETMISWPKGKRNSDGIWEKIWYQNVKSSTGFEILRKDMQKLPEKYKRIYLECLDIYKELNSHNILNEK